MASQPDAERDAERVLRLLAEHGAALESAKGPLPTLTDAQTTLTDISMVGQYALAPTWADGHHTGFYTFQRLRDECPCPEDVARRAAASRTATGRAHEHRSAPRGAERTDSA